MAQHAGQAQARAAAAHLHVQHVVLLQRRPKQLRRKTCRQGRRPEERQIKSTQLPPGDCSASDALHLLPPQAAQRCDLPRPKPAPVCQPHAAAAFRSSNTPAIMLSGGAKSVTLTLAPMGISLKRSTGATTTSRLPSSRLPYRRSISVPLHSQGERGQGRSAWSDVVKAGYVCDWALLEKQARQAKRYAAKRSRRQLLKRRQAGTGHKWQAAGGRQEAAPQVCDADGGLLPRLRHLELQPAKQRGPRAYETEGSCGRRTPAAEPADKKGLTAAQQLHRWRRAASPNSAGSLSSPRRDRLQRPTGAAACGCGRGGPAGGWGSANGPEQLGR